MPSLFNENLQKFHYKCEFSCMDWEFYALQYIQQDVIINQRLTVSKFIQKQVPKTIPKAHIFFLSLGFCVTKKTLLKNFTTEITLSYTQHSSRVVQGRDYPEEIFQKKERLSCFQFTLCYLLVRVQLSSAGCLCSAVAAGKQPQPTHNFSQTQTSFCAVSYCCLCPTDCLPACQISQPVQPRPDSAELAQWTLRM